MARNGGNSARGARWGSSDRDLAAAPPRPNDGDPSGAPRGARRRLSAEARATAPTGEGARRTVAASPLPSGGAGVRRYLLTPTTATPAAPLAAVTPSSLRRQPPWHPLPYPPTPIEPAGRFQVCFGRYATTAARQVISDCSFQPQLVLFLYFKFMLFMKIDFASPAPGGLLVAVSMTVASAAEKHDRWRMSGRVDSQVVERRGDGEDGSGGRSAR